MTTDFPQSVPHFAELALPLPAQVLTAAFGTDKKDF
jgi:hypothetical protein